MPYRFADQLDGALLGALNTQLIRDEGHRNPMTASRLAERLTAWRADEYQAVLFESDGETVGSALFRRETECVYVRQFFVYRDVRRRGIGREALEWLWKHAWSDAERLRMTCSSGSWRGSRSGGPSASATIA